MRIRNSQKAIGHPAYRRLTASLLRAYRDDTIGVPRVAEK